MNDRKKRKKAKKKKQCGIQSGQREEEGPFDFSLESHVKLLAWQSNKIKNKNCTQFAVIVRRQNRLLQSNWFTLICVLNCNQNLSD